MPALTPLALARLTHPHYKWAPFHHHLQADLLKLLTKQLRHPDGRPCRRLLVMTPPQHAKSLITSRLFPPIALAQDPANKIILLSYSSELATGHGSVARDYCTEFGNQLDPSGRLQIRTDSRSKSYWRTTAEGHMISGSIQGTVTGRSATGMIIDDPFKGSEDSGSVVIRDKVWATYSAAAETRLTPDGFVCLINTVWHPDDLSGRLLAAEPDQWMVRRYPALAEENCPLGRKPGEGLFLSKYPQGWYEAKRAAYEQRGLSHIWQALYQCSPTGDPTLRAFPDSYFGEWLWVDGLPVCEDNPERYRVLALDPCKSKTGKVGDYAAFADLTVLKDNVVYADMHLLRPTLPVLHATAMALIVKAIDEGRPYRAMIVECNMFQQAVAVAIAKELAAKGIALHVEEHQTGPDQEKNARMFVGLGPYLHNRKLKFIGKTLSNRLTVTQMTEIPNGAHDDGPDSIELGLQLLNLIHSGTKRPIAQKVLRV